MKDKKPVCGECEELRASLSRIKNEVITAHNYFVMAWEKRRREEALEGVRLCRDIEGVLE